MDWRVEVPTAFKEKLAMCTLVQNVGVKINLGENYFQLSCVKDERTLKLLMMIACWVTYVVGYYCAPLKCVYAHHHVFAQCIWFSKTNHMQMAYNLSSKLIGVKMWQALQARDGRLVKFWVLDNNGSRGPTFAGTHGPKREKDIITRFINHKFVPTRPSYRRTHWDEPWRNVHGLA